jgi:excinuclease ABC subunit A
MTELCDYLKLLWPRVARLHCRQCGQPVRKDSPQQIGETLQGALPEGARRTPPEFLVTFTLPLAEKLSLEDSLNLISKQGYQRILFGEEIVRLDEVVARSAQLPAPIRSLIVIQDRLKLSPANRARFVEACEQAYHFGKGKLAVYPLEPTATQPGGTLREPQRFSRQFHCAACDLDYREPTPALFSFNHPVGACPTCRGFGRTITIDYDRVLPDRTRTLAEGVVKPWQTGHGLESHADLLKFCKKLKLPTQVPFSTLPEAQQQWVIEGDPGYLPDDPDNSWPKKWYGVKGYFRWLESKAYKMHVRVLLSRYRAYQTCPACGGKRLQPEALLYRLALPTKEVIRGSVISNQAAALPNRSAAATGLLNTDSPITGYSLADFYALSIRDALHVVESLRTAASAGPHDPLGLVLEEIRARLGYLAEVGLDYLTLDRPTRTLSGGETERVNLTTCLGTRLVNTLYVLDEPSVGLHPRDTARLVGILQRLRDAGNTVVVVEHEASVMRAADQIVDLGPGHGGAGGQVVFQGAYPAILTAPESLTGQYLSGRKCVESPARRAVILRKDDSSSPPPTAALTLTGANTHNLKNLTVSIPLGRLVCLTGVSGSGKTTLVWDVLLPLLEARLKATPARPDLGEAAATLDEDTGADAVPGSLLPAALISGWEALGQVVLVDQSALGRTPRSNPAVYLGAFDDIREVFAHSEPARRRGLNASAFSFNSAQGQCEHCRGAGFEKIEMQFLSDVFIRCPACEGRRYRAHILEVKLSGGGIRESVISNPSSATARKPATAASLNPGSPITDLLIPDPLDTKDWNIADTLAATVDEAIRFFQALADSRPAQRAVARLQLLQEVGLGYLQLGQPINTLSGGESQRLKLVSHLAESVTAASDCRTSAGSKSPQLRGGGHRPPRPVKPTLFLFDEPTTGLHFEDTRVLLQVFQRLVDAGHSVLIIEHNLDVIQCADWLIDLGPEAGELGGQVVGQGPPEVIAGDKRSHTGRALREMAGIKRRTKALTKALVETHP